MAFKSLEAQREYMREWRARNPGYQKAHYAKNAEKRRAEKRAAYADDPDTWKSRAKRYRKENPDKYREQKSRYRAENAEKERDRIRKWVKANPDKAGVQNAKRVLREQVGLPIRDIPRELAEAKAEQLKITRWVREQLALAAGTQSAETNEDSAQSEGCQSGPKGSAQHSVPNDHQ